MSEHPCVPSKDPPCDSRGQLPAGIVFSRPLTAILGAKPSYLHLIMKTYFTYRTVNTPNPLANTMSNHFLYYPTPSNLNYN